MSVKDRLQRLTGEKPQPKGQASNKEVINELRKKIDAIMERRDRIEARPAVSYQGPVRALEQVITGEEVENSHGKFYFCRNRFKGSGTHGNHLISTLAAIDMISAGYLAGTDALAALSITDGLFLDTETTGLAGGTGTFAFLIGLGWFEGDDFIVCQLFARDFSEEQALLFFLREIAESKRFLVTFNGRAYDMNLLASRYILNRLHDPFTDMPHLDLLHPSRRLVGHRLENSRLTTLEACVLGFERHGDVPGYEIPGRYFDWLRRRDAGLMEDVFEHNRLDIISMAALAKHLAELLSGSDGGMAGHAADVLAAARLHHDRGNVESARQFYECIIKAGKPGFAKDARRSLSLMHKRAGCWDEAVSIWEEMLAENPCDVFAAQELAKWLEHKRHDYARAVKIVEGLLDDASGLSEEERESLRYRLNRLKGKHAKADQA
jgi:uncharacterized protein YprB with RNaseH-like and TPR domain